MYCLHGWWHKKPHAYLHAVTSWSPLSGPSESGTRQRSSDLAVLIKPSRHWWGRFFFGGGDWNVICAYSVWCSKTSAIVWHRGTLSEAWSRAAACPSFFGFPFREFIFYCTGCNDKTPLSSLILLAFENLHLAFFFLNSWLNHSCGDWILPESERRTEINVSDPHNRYHFHLMWNFDEVSFNRNPWDVLVVSNSSESSGDQIATGGRTARPCYLSFLWARNALDCRPIGYRQLDWSAEIFWIQSFL